MLRRGDLDVDGDAFSADRSDQIEVTLGRVRGDHAVRSRPPTRARRPPARARRSTRASPAPSSLHRRRPWRGTRNASPVFMSLREGKTSSRAGSPGLEQLFTTAGFASRLRRRRHGHRRRRDARRRRGSRAGDGRGVAVAVDQRIGARKARHRRRAVLIVDDELSCPVSFITMRRVGGRGRGDDGRGRGSFGAAWSSACARIVRLPTRSGWSARGRASAPSSRRCSTLAPPPKPRARRPSP